MFFNSVEFVIFLPIAFVLYWYVFSRSNRTQNLFLFLASYVFYAFANYKFLALIAFTTTCTYFTSLSIEHFRDQGYGGKAKLMSAVNIFANLLVLGFFKYYNFFVSSFASLFPGINADSLILNIILPLGISYYTFSSLSYSIDVYLGKTKSCKDFVQVATYISFFPQLLAGPIGRSTYLLPQYSIKREFSYRDCVDGLRQILWGLFKKVVVADKCAEYVNKVWGSFPQYSSIELFFVLILFAFQVYGDFSGYSDIAIGISKLFGIKLKQNFRFPIFSRNIPDFWSRWHISLTSWLGDYIYVPLGGGWSKLSIIVKIFIVFTICGLWHGAGWNYVLWGIYNALLFVPFVLCFKYRRPKNVSSKERIAKSIKTVMIALFSQLLLVFGLLVFRSETISQFFVFLKCLVEFDNPIFDSCFIQITLKRVAVIFVMLIIEWMNRKEEYGLALRRVKTPVLRYLIYYVLAFSILICGGSSQPFVYFQF